MKVAGFTIVRNAIKYEYPFMESIQSLLNLCDEVVVAVGMSEDNTLQEIKNLKSKKLRIVESVWDDTLREGGKVLAIETDKAFQHISPDVDWAIYLQADEVIHERDHERIKIEMKRWLDNRKVDGFLFRYLHFYGSYNFVAHSPNWYEKEIRIVRNSSEIYSYRDAQGFRKGNNRKLRVKAVNARIYHYGWVRTPSIMQQKHLNFAKFYNIQTRSEEAERDWDYSQIDVLKEFGDKHPGVMAKRIETRNWQFEYDPASNSLSLKNWLKVFLRKYLGLQIGYKNYRLI